MEETQWWSSEKIQQLQCDKLNNILSYITTHVPYYKNLFETQGITIESIRSIEDLQKIPFLTKEVIRNNIEDLKSGESHDLSRFNTGGSSGAPLIFYIGNERVSHDVAAKWRATRWWDVDIGDPEVVVWGSPIELGAQDIVRKVRDKMLRTSLLAAFDMSNEKLDGFIENLVSRRPKMVFGYPSSISYIAAYAEAQGKKLNNIGVKVVFVTSEKLYDHQRLVIERVFGCKVANGYGGRDAGFIAHECPSGNMHITAEDIIVEIIDQQGKVVPMGQSGEIVVTHLATKMFPFIRYKVGDVGTLTNDKCACGRGLPILEEISGRTTDFIVAKNGSVMHGLALIYILRDLPGVTEFKIVQESIDLTRVIISVDDDFLTESTQKIEKKFQERLGKDVTISVEIVDNVPAEKSGKFRYVISKVSVANQNN